MVIASARKTPVSHSHEQLSMLPSPVDSAILQSVSQGSAINKLRGPGADPSNDQKRYAVVGEKQFKNPLLFPPPKTKGLDQPRRIVFGSNLAESGESIERSIEVLGNNVTSGYSSDTLEVIAVINEIWRLQGSSPEGAVFGTYAEVARRLNKDENNSARHRKAVARELERLRRCILIFSQYFTKDQLKRNQEITYFSDYEYVTDRKNPANNYFRATIDPSILENIRSGNISSLPVLALLALKFDKSKPVLLRIDSVLAVQERCELSSETVYELAAIELTEWTRKPVNKKRTLLDICTDIDCKVLSSGWQVKASLQSNVKGECVKLVFVRGDRIYIKENAHNIATKGLRVVNTDPVVVQYLVNEMSRVVGESSGNESLYSLYARSYSEEIILRALSEFRADRPADLRSPGAFFSTVLCRIVQEFGHAWIR